MPTRLYFIYNYPFRVTLGHQKASPPPSPKTHIHIHLYIDSWIPKTPKAPDSCLRESPAQGLGSFHSSGPLLLVYGYLVYGYEGFRRRVQVLRVGSGLRVWYLGFSIRVEGLVSRVLGLGVCGLGFAVK